MNQEVLANKASLREETGKWREKGPEHGHVHKLLTGRGEIPLQYLKSLVCATERQAEAAFRQSSS